MRRYAEAQRRIVAAEAGEEKLREQLSELQAALEAETEAAGIALKSLAGQKADELDAALQTARAEASTAAAQLESQIQAQAEQLKVVRLNIFGHFSVFPFSHHATYAWRPWLAAE